MATYGISHSARIAGKRAPGAPRIRSQASGVGRIALRRPRRTVVTVLAVALAASSAVVALLAALVVISVVAPPSKPAEASFADAAGKPGGAGGAVASPQPPPGPPLPPEALARIPKFAAAPKAEPMVIPDGPSAPLLFRIETTQKVAFITIDDGWEKRPEFLQLVYAAKVPVSLFLTVNAIRDNPGYFKQLQSYGAVVENHTLTHANLQGMSYDFQKREICGAADQLGSLYGRKPVLFRPPFGNRDANTLKAARDCGNKAAFYWTQDVDKGVVHFAEGSTVKPGDIFLLHLRPAFIEDFLVTLKAIHDAGLTPALLEDYIAS